MTLLLFYLIVLVKGLFAGFIYTAACMTSSLYALDALRKHGKGKSLTASIGIALSHLLWATCAILTLNFIFKRVEEYRSLYTIVGSILLLYFALKTYQKRKTVHTLYQFPIKNHQAFFQGLLFGLSSPGKVIGYAIIYSAFGISQTDPHLYQKVPLLLGTGLGSFLFLTIFILKIEVTLQHNQAKMMGRMHRIAAFIMLPLAIGGLTIGLMGLSGFYIPTLKAPPPIFQKSKPVTE